MPLRFLFLTTILILAACSEEQRAARAEQRREQIQTDIAEKGKAGTLSFEDFGRALDEMAELDKERPPLEERLREAAREQETQLQQLRDTRERQARERQAQAAEAELAAAARLEQLRPQAVAAIEAATAHYDEFLTTLQQLADTQPTPGDRFWVEHELAQRQRSKDRAIKQLHDLLADHNLPSVEAALTRAQNLIDQIQLAIDDANARLATRPQSNL